MEDFIDRKRISIVLYLFLIISILIIIRIIFLSSVKIEDFVTLQENRVVINRGEIVDRNSRILAINDEMHSIYANPRDIQDKQAAAKIISETLSIDYNEIYQKLRSNRKFIWIKRFASPDESKRITALKLRGVNFVKEYKRIYPNKSLASHILGFCNIDNQGVEGIEKTFNQTLLNSNIDESLSLPKGNNIQLTIDSSLQAIAEKTLKSAAVKEGAEIGTLILIDGYNGDILAMANYPDYDPNRFSSFSQREFRNNSVFYQFEPGSVMKVFSIASVIDNGGITENTVFNCNGFYEKGSYRVRCNEVHHRVTAEGIMKFSCNSGTLQAMEKIKDSDFHRYLKSFGFGSSTGIELPGEQNGILRNINNWSQRSMLSVPIGQEISVNALQMAQAATVFTNDGVLLKTNIVRKIYDNNGKVIFNNEKNPIRRVLKPGVSDTIIDSMKTATDRGGTVSNLKVDGIKFASKSGTAQIFDQQTMQYSNIEVSSSLLVIFPLEAPRYIVFTAFHKPTARVRWGGVICANLLNDFIGGITGYLNVFPPDYEIEKSYIDKPIVYERIRTLPAAMPDLRGFNPGDVSDIFSQLNLKITFSGSGKVYSHIPLPGEIISRNSALHFELK